MLKIKNSGLTVRAGRVRDFTAATQPPDATRSAEIPRRGALDDTTSMHLHELPEGSRSYSEENVFHCSNMSPDGNYMMRAKLYIEDSSQNEPGAYLELWNVIDPSNSFLQERGQLRASWWPHQELFKKVSREGNVPIVPNGLQDLPALMTISDDLRCVRIGHCLFINNSDHITTALIPVAQSFMSSNPFWEEVTHGGALLCLARRRAPRHQAQLSLECQSICMDHTRSQEVSKDIKSDSESLTFSDSLDEPVNYGSDNGSDISFERESDKMSDINLLESDTASTDSDHAFSEMSNSDPELSGMSEVLDQAEMTEDDLSDDLGTNISVSSDFSDSSSEAAPRISVAGCDSCGKSVYAYLPYRLGPGYPWLTTGSMSYYHCKTCPLGPDHGTFDLCEKCFANDKWCGSKSHLLSKRSTSEDYYDQKDNYAIKYNPFKARQDLVIFDNSTETLKPIFHLYSNSRDSVLSAHPAVHPLRQAVAWLIDEERLVLISLKDGTATISSRFAQINKTYGLHAQMRFSSCGNYLYIISLEVPKISTHKFSTKYGHRYTSRVQATPQDLVQFASYRLTDNQGCLEISERTMLHRFELLGRPDPYAYLPFSVTWPRDEVFVTFVDCDYRLLLYSIILEEAAVDTGKRLIISGDAHRDQKQSTKIPADDQERQQIRTPLCVLKYSILLPQEVRQQPIQLFGFLTDHVPTHRVFFRDRDGFARKVGTLSSMSSPDEAVNNVGKTQEKASDDLELPQSIQIRTETAPTEVVLSRNIEPDSHGNWTEDLLAATADRAMRKAECNNCIDLTRRLFTFKVKTSQMTITNTGEQINAMTWDTRVRNLVEAASLGCPFCSFITWHVFPRQFYYFFEDRKPGWNRWHPSIVQIEQSQRLKVASGGLLQHPGDPEVDIISFGVAPGHTNGSRLPDFDTFRIVPNSLGIHKETKRKTGMTPGEITVEVSTTKEDPAAEFISNRPIERDQGSSESFGIARAWLEECCQDHEQCASGEEPLLPTRVLDVTDADNIKLFISGGRARYAALSYCWGGAQPHATTLKTVGEYIRHIPGLYLPRTVHDAIKVTRELGLRYLWVDALCIIQDSSEDKSKEISHMNVIYKNSHLTISAASAEKCSEGFLQKRRIHGGLEAGKDPFHMQYQCPDDVRGLVILREEAPYHPFWEATRARAWTLQEHVLSPRILIYGARMIWKCNHRQVSYGGIQDWSFEPHHSQDRVFSQILPVKLKEEADFRNRVYQSWYSLVNDFTRRELSIPSDKLPALAGIVQEMARLTGDIYLAGLWKTSLLHDLMWSLPSSTKYRHSSVWRAPSWSWASVDNAVRYGRIDADAIPLARVIRCEVVPASKVSHFGEVISGELELEGAVVQLSKEHFSLALEKERLAEAPPSNKEVAFGWGHWYRSMLQQVLDNMQEDKFSEPEWPETAYALVLFQVSRAKTMVEDLGEAHFRARGSFSGLLLEKLGDGRFKRLGTFFDHSDEWLRSATYETKKVLII